MTSKVQRAATSRASSTLDATLDKTRAAAASKCLSCSRNVTSRSKALQCGLCEGWAHTTCSGIEHDLYECLKRTASSALTFHCDKCRLIVNDKSLLANLTLAKKTDNNAALVTPVLPPVTPPCIHTVRNRSRSSSASSAETPMHSSQDNRKKPSVGTPTATATYAAVASAGAAKPPGWVQAPKKKSCKAVNNNKSKSPSTVSQLKSVLNKVTRLEKLLAEKPALPKPVKPSDSKSPRGRLCNVMIFHAPESTDPSPQVRYDHDVQFLQSLTDKLLDVGEPGLRVKQVTRLGKQVDGKCRPLRIAFADETAPRLVLSRLGRLKGMKIHVRPDLDPAEREQLKSAVVELKRRTDAGETNLRIVNFRTVARIPRIRVNRAVTLQARPAVPTADCV
ncbi:unnamed protein product [Dicrocoelium dendriticum]|nr:unnamed protein product [Dicrocoelium dendriticum]